MRVIKLLKFLALVLILNTQIVSQAISEEAAPLKVGIIIPLTGPLAAMGQSFKKGLDLFEQENPTSSKKISFLLEDSKYEGKTAVSAFHKLRDVDKVNAAVVWGNTPASAVAPVAERVGLPTLTISSNPDALGREQVCSFGFKIEAVAKTIYQQFQSWNSLAAVAVSADLGNALKAVDLLKKLLADKLTIKVIAADDNNFRSLIVNLRQQKPDAVLLFAMPDQALNFIKQAQELNFNPKIIGGDIFADQDFHRQIKSYKNDLVFVYGGVEQKFINSLNQKFGTVSYFFESATGFTVAKIFSRIANQKAVGNLKNLLKALESVSIDDLPIAGFHFVRDEEYGAHFEADLAVYSAQEFGHRGLGNYHM